MDISRTRMNINHVITTGRVVGLTEKNINKSSFQEVFQDVLDNNIKFSKHAATRMRERNINLSSVELSKILEAIDKASAKGIKDSLVLMKDIAFVVNIPSRTIITAVDGKTMKENIFTNIDGAVIL